MIIFLAILAMIGYLMNRLPRYIPNNNVNNANGLLKKSK